MLKRFSRLGLTLFFIAAGVAHFVKPGIYVAIMPPYLPAHLELVYLSGIFEILGGLGVIPLVTRKWAGYGLIALLLAVLPANLHMTIHSESYIEVAPLWVLFARLPLQFVFIAWVYWSTKVEGCVQTRG